MTSPLRLMLWHWGRHGGGPRYTFELAKALRGRSDVELFLSVSRQSEIAHEFAELGIPTHWVDTYNNVPSCIARTALLPVTASRFIAYLRNNRIEAVNSTMTHLWTRICMPVVRRTVSRTICTIHDATQHPGESTILKNWIYAPVPDADQYIALTQFVARRMNEVHRIPLERISVVPHGVFEFGTAPKNIRTSPISALRLLFFGRILPYKGLDRLLESYRVLRERNYPLTLHIAGSGDLGPLSKPISMLPGVTLDQRWIPEDEIPDVLASADVVVLPYIEASQSGVIPTAFGLGLPVVATPVGGLTEQVTHERNGLLSHDLSIDALTSALERFFEDPLLLNKLSNGALTTARTEFSWNKVSELVVSACRAGDLQRSPPPKTH